MNANKAIEGYVYRIDSLGPASRAAGLEYGHQYVYFYAPNTNTHVFKHIEDDHAVGLHRREARDVIISIYRRANT